MSSSRMSTYLCAYKYTKINNIPSADKNPFANNYNLTSRETMHMKL